MIRYLQGNKQENAVPLVTEKDPTKLSKFGWAKNTDIIYLAKL